MDHTDWVELKVSIITRTGHEWITRFDTNIKNQDIFYTNNDLEWNARQFVGSNPIASNYYPMVAGAKIHDTDDQLTILTTHSVGCGSLATGSLEMMIHRSLTQDDGRGLSEPVKDDTMAEVSLYLNLNTPSMENDLYERKSSIRFNSPVIILFAPALKNVVPVILLAKRPFPDFVHLFSLAPRNAFTDEIVIRLQSLSNSKAATFEGKVSDYFYTSAESFREVSLSLNYGISNMFVLDYW